jgi:DNA repair protein RecN (Recombination protein N)
VTASFDVAPGHPVWSILSANDIAAGDELILRRVQLSDGRTRAFVNDQPVSVQVLKSLGTALVEIHGQHDERALVDVATHRMLLDAYGGLETDVAETGRAWSDWRAAVEAFEAHRARVEQASREADWLRHAVEELKTLAPTSGEETALAARRTAMMQAEKVAGDLRDAHDAVAGTRSAVPMLASAVRRLERRAAQAPALVEPAVKSLDAALHALEDARGHLETALRTADHDPRELERIEERLFALRAAGRKYNVAVDDLAALAARYAADLAALDAGAQDLGRLEARARDAEAHYRARASGLSASRRRAGAKLDKAVSAELKPLKLERARFSTEIASELAAAGPGGIDRVEFWVQTNPGTRGSAPTLIFDEVDTGVGGAVADAIGVRLARLAGRVQVVAVTHAPQVAARADRHYLISKDTLDRGKRVATRVSEVAAERRREEIARMLAGAEITEEARAAAERLIRAAAG